MIFIRCPGRNRRGPPWFRPIPEIRVSISSSDFALSRLYAQHHGWLVAWLRRKLGCPDDAADLSHDPCLRLLNGEDPDRLGEPRADLLVIANRLLINRQRRCRVEAEALQQVAVLLERQEQRGPAQTVAARERLAQVLFLITEELPEKPRRAFLMARVDGLSYRAIAERLGVSESSVEQYRAKVLAYCPARLDDSLASAPACATGRDIRRQRQFVRGRRGNAVGRRRRVRLERPAVLARCQQPVRRGVHRIVHQRIRLLLRLAARRPGERDLRMVTALRPSAWPGRPGMARPSVAETPRTLETVIARRPQATWRSSAGKARVAARRVPESIGVMGP